MDFDARIDEDGVAWIHIAYEDWHGSSMRIEADTPEQFALSLQSALLDLSLDINQKLLEKASEPKPKRPRLNQ